MNRKYSFLLPIVLLFIIKISGHAQQINTNAPWYKGEITLGDESMLSGAIQYTNGDVALFFKENIDDEDKKMIYTSDILSLEYYDESLGITRTYHSMAFPNMQTGEEEIGFYEVLKQYATFAVLERMGNLKVVKGRAERSIPTYTNIPFATAISVFSSRSVKSKTQDIFFLSESGDFEKYISVLFKKVAAKIYGYKYEDVKFINPSLFPKYLGTHWPEVNQYLKEQRIKLDRRETIIQALNYYDKLLIRDAYK